MGSPVRRIGYINPYLGLAEDQAFQSLRTAASRIGVELISLLPSDLQEGDNYDFVISTTAAVRKTTSHPTFLSAHTPRKLYVDTEEAFARTASYDGYLCISDNLVRFFTDLAHSRRAPLLEPGAYYNSPQAVDMAADLSASAAGGNLALCYFGTNWDGRASRLFVRLAGRPYMRIYGPEGSWRDLPHGAYKGSVPFDGVSVQTEYARHGVGLVCLSDDHLIDDIVSNRVFEISSVGACAICPDTPWMRASFGDAVYYYDAFATPEETAQAIDACMAEIAADPGKAADKAKRARAVFEAKFEAGVMLRNAIDYHDRWQAARQVRADALPESTIDVVVRTGGRSLDFLKRALASLESQTSGRFRVILVCYKRVDLSEITRRKYRRIVEFVVREELGGNRSRTLVDGLSQVESEYFAILDDDDYLLADHFHNLLRAMRRSDAVHRFAYSDILQHDESRGPQAPWNNGRAILKEGPAWGDIHTLLQRFSPHCFLATSASLQTFAFSHWVSDTAEDVLVIGNLLAIAEPIHSPGATCVYSVGREGASNYVSDPNRIQDELTLVTSLSQIYGHIEDKFPPAPREPRALVYPVMGRLTEQIRERAQGARPGQAVLGQWQPVGHAADPSAIGALVDDPELVCVPVPLSADRCSGNADMTRASDGTVRIVPKAAWELSLVVDLSDYVLGEYTAATGVCLTQVTEPVGFGLVDDRFDVVRKVVVPNATGRLMAAIKNLDRRPLLAAAVQAGARPATAPVIVEGVWVGYRLADLRTHFGEADLDRGRAQILLEDALSNQILGAAPPADADLRRQAVDFRSSLCVYRTDVSDGPMKDGAVRTIRLGVVPWDYFAQIRAPREQIAASDWLHVTLGSCEGAFHVMLVKADMSQLLTERFRPRKRGRIDIWLDCRDLDEDAYLIFQADEGVTDGAVQLHSVEAVSRV